MSADSGTNQGPQVLKLKVMIINTSELEKLLEDEDFDGITLQLSHAIGNRSIDNDDGHRFMFIPYKHFSSKKKQEQISDKKFFSDGAEMYKEIEIGGGGIVSHFGNLKITRGDMEENIDTDEYPYFILTPEHGTGEYENYIVCNASYAANLDNLGAQPQALSRGLATAKSTGSKVINPSPPA